MLNLRIVAFYLCMVVFLQAQNIPTLGEIQAKRTSSNASQVVLDKKKIELTGATTVAEALKIVSGLYISHNANNDYISVRGAKENQTIFLLNGIPINDMMSTMITLSTININSIERIEIYKNSDYRFLSENAIGGIINIVTKDISYSPFQYALSITSQKDFNWYASATIPYKTHRINITFSGDAGEGDYNYISQQEHIKRNIKHEHTSEQYSFYYTYDTPLSYFHRLELGVFYNTGEKRNPGSDQYPTPNANTDYFFGGNSVKVSILPKAMEETFRWEVFNNVNYQYKENLNFDDFHHDSYRYEYAKDTVFSMFKYSHPHIIVDVHSKYSISKINSNALSFEKNPSSKQRQNLDNTLAFDIPIQDFNILNSYALNVLNFQKSYFKAFVGLKYHYQDIFSTQINYQKQLRYPEYDELFWRDNGVTVGNENLKNEESHQLGFDNQAFLKYLTLSSSFYYRWITNLIQWQHLQNTWHPVNYGKARIWGLDNSIETMNFHGFSSTVFYDFLRVFDSSETSSNAFFQMPYHPKHTLGIILSYESPIAVGVNTIYKFTSPMYISQRETRYRSPLNLWDINLSYHYQHYISMQLNFINILNIQYEDAVGYPNSGFEVSFQIRGYI